MILCVPRYMLKSSQTTKAFDCLTQNNGIIFQQSKQHDVAIMYCNIAVFGFNSYLQFVYMFIPQCSGIIKCERLRTNGFYLRQIYGYFMLQDSSMSSSLCFCTKCSLLTDCKWWLQVYWVEIRLRTEGLHTHYAMDIMLCIEDSKGIAGMYCYIRAKVGIKSWRCATVENALFVHALGNTDLS